MRIENQPGQSVSENARSSATRSAGAEATTGHVALSSTGTDHVSLSGASNLLGLAKSLPSAKQHRIAAITNQYNAGTYRADAAATGRSLIEQHLSA